MLSTPCFFGSIGWKKFFFYSYVFSSSGYCSHGLQNMAEKFTSVEWQKEKSCGWKQISEKYYQTWEPPDPFSLSSFTVKFNTSVQIFSMVFSPVCSQEAHSLCFSRPLSERCFSFHFAGVWHVILLCKTTARRKSEAVGDTMRDPAAC